MTTIDALIVLELSFGAILLAIIWCSLFRDALGDRARIQIRELEQTLFFETIEESGDFQDDNYRATAAFLNAAYSMIDVSPLSFFCLTVFRPMNKDSDSSIIDASKPKYFRKIEHQAVRILITLMTRRSILLTIVNALSKLNRIVNNKEPEIKVRISEGADILGRKPSLLNPAFLNSLHHSLAGGGSARFGAAG